VGLRGGGGHRRPGLRAGYRDRAQSSVRAGGNKRTGFACAIDFLESNGFPVPDEEDDSLGRTLEAVVAGTLPEEAFIEHLRQLLEAEL